MESVSCQFQEYHLGDLRALLRRNPFIIHLRTAITLGVFDKGRMDGVGDVMRLKRNKFNNFDQMFLASL